jgi:hypothetical protein
MTMALLTRKEQKERLAILDARADSCDARAALHAAGGLASNMTLRDAAALKALRYIMGDERTGSYAHAAAESYKMADAMLEARKTTGEGDA